MRPTAELATLLIAALYQAGQDLSLLDANANANVAPVDLADAGSEAPVLYPPKESHLYPRMCRRISFSYKKTEIA